MPTTVDLPPLELDVRNVPRPKRHPLIEQTFQELPVGSALILINNHDPLPLHKEFTLNYPRGFSWEYLQTGPEVWKIQITRLATTPLPRVLRQNTEVSQGVPDPAGAIFKLQMVQRDLDSNIIHLTGESAITGHAGPDVDVLVYVISGEGQIATEIDSLPVVTGDLVWLPRNSHRAITPGPQGLQYLTVHQRRPGLSIGHRP